MHHQICIEYINYPGLQIQRFHIILLSLLKNSPAPLYPLKCSQDPLYYCDEILALFLKKKFNCNVLWAVWCSVQQTIGFRTKPNLSNIL